MIIEQKGSLFIQDHYINYGNWVISRGDQRRDREMVREGLKDKCAGLILQNPLVEDLKKLIKPS